MEKLKSFLRTGPIYLSLSERARKMTDAYKVYKEHATAIEAEIAAQRADIDAAHRRIAALQAAPAPATPVAVAP